MNFTTKITVVAALATGTIWAAACGSSSSGSATGSATVGPTTASGTGGATSSTAGTGGSSTSTMASGTGGNMPPPPPTLGAQIDRMGRPAINTIGSKTFDTAANRDAAETAYNKESDPTKWVAAFKANIAQDIAILDALDAADPAGCGNQFGVPPATKTAMGAYDAASALLADDRLRLFTGGNGQCGLYLAVEANALGVANQFCGGRTPVDDVIDESYSILAGVQNFMKLPQQTGAMGAFPFGDGIPVDPALNTAFMAGFPFFAAAH